MRDEVRKIWVFLVSIMVMMAFAWLFGRVWPKGPGGASGLGALAAFLIIGSGAMYALWKFTPYERAVVGSLEVVESLIGGAMDALARLPPPLPSILCRGMAVLVLGAGLCIPAWQHRSPAVAAVFDVSRINHLYLNQADIGMVISRDGKEILVGVRPLPEMLKAARPNAQFGGVGLPSGHVAALLKYQMPATTKSDLEWAIAQDVAELLNGKSPAHAVFVGDLDRLPGGTDVVLNSVMLPGVAAMAFGVGQLLMSVVGLLFLAPILGARFEGRKSVAYAFATCIPAFAVVMLPVYGLWAVTQ